MSIYLTDTRKEQLNMKRLLAAIAATILILLAWNAAPDRVQTPNLCPAEDEVPIQLRTDAFDMKQGETRCIHIDLLNEG